MVSGSGTQEPRDISNPDTRQDTGTSGDISKPGIERWLNKAREFAGLSVWQPHTKVTTQKGETGF